MRGSSSGRAPSVASPSQAGRGLVVGGVQGRCVSCRVAGRLGDDHVGQQHGPLPPVVDGHHLADDRHDPVGEAPVVGRDVGQVFDLAHHVVAEVAHQAAVERRQALDGRRAVVGQEVLQGGQHPPIGPDAVR